MSMTSFSDLRLLTPLLDALSETGYTQPTPIQQQAIPVILEGRDLLGIAQTGTGKTAAFCLPILQRLHSRPVRLEPRSPRSLILTPTRELAIQIHKNLETYGKHLRKRTAVIFGGVGQGPQVQALSRGVDVLVATPGRLLDLVDQMYLKLDRVEIFVLDEADRMLDMGFMRDIRKILPLLPRERHNLFFSATMPDEIQGLAQSILRDPQRIEVTPPATTVERINQTVMFVDKQDKLDLLIDVLKDNNLYKVLVFVEMKHFANKVVDKLTKAGVSAAAIHGNKSQSARQRALTDFTEDRTRVLVATDIASRGIDVDGITHVINFELPHLVENYVHRIGRTARAGHSGEAISFCTAEEKSFLFAIEKATRQRIGIISDHAFHSESALNAPVIGVGKAKAALESQRRSNSRRPPSGGGRRGPPRFGRSSARR